MKQGGAPAASSGFMGTVLRRRLGSRFGRTQLRSAGFTIVETLIVLAVTGALFVMAALSINGRQGKTEFQRSSNDFLQQLQQISNETASGFSASSDSVKCTKGAPPMINSGGAGVGSNGDCIFLGKVLQMGVTPDTMHVWPVVGNRLDQTYGEPVQNLPAAYPIALPQSDGGEDLSLEYGMSIDGVGASMVYDNGGAPTPTRGVGFLSDLSANYDSTRQATGGSGQQLALYAVQGSAGDTGYSLGPQINTANLVPTKQVQICLNSGGTNQSALYTIGSDNNPVAITMKIQYTRCP